MYRNTAMVYYGRPIQHYGVLGMKWGVRKSKDERRSDREKKEAEKAERNRRKQVRKNRRTLSDDELRKEVDRLTLEKKFKDLSDADLAPGRSAVGSFLKTQGGKALASAAVGGIAYLGYSAITGDFDLKRAADYIFPNPNRKK